MPVQGQPWRQIRPAASRMYSDSTYLHVLNSFDRGIVGVDIDI